MTSFNYRLDYDRVDGICLCVSITVYVSGCLCAGVCVCLSDPAVILQYQFRTVLFLA